MFGHKGHCRLTVSPRVKVPNSYGDEYDVVSIFCVLLTLRSIVGGWMIEHFDHHLDNPFGAGIELDRSHRE